MAAPGRAIGAAYEPKRFGAYWLLDPIADSRFGIVFRAGLRRGRLADKLLAIKRISPELSRDARFAACFLDVMSGAARLRHPAHCAIEDVGRTDGVLYQAMEWVPGVDLARVLARLRQRELSMPVPLVLHIASQIAAALAAAHRATRAGGPAPLFHGELAPSNILLGYDGRVKLTGIGSAALLAAAPELAARAAYRSPELAHGAACSASSDLFSLGACLYELLAGEPYAGPDGVARPGQPRPGSSIRRRIPGPLEPIVSRALAEQPAARWSNAADLGRALDRVAASHGPRANAGALGAFLLAHFDAERNAETTRLEALLAMIAPTARSTGSSTRQRAVSSEPPPPPPADHAAPAAPFDPAERTPPRGNVMQELAARMRAEPGLAQHAAPSQHEAPRPITEVRERKSPVPEPSPPPAPARAAAQPAIAPPAVPAAEQGWDEYEPAPMWISSSEELAQASSSRTTGDSWSLPLRPQPARPAIAQRAPASAAGRLPVSAVPQAGLALKLGVIASSALLVGLGVLALWPSAGPKHEPPSSVPAAHQRAAAPKTVAPVQAEPAAMPATVAAPAARVPNGASSRSADDVRLSRRSKESSEQEPAPGKEGSLAQPASPSASSDDPLAELDEEPAAAPQSSPSVFRLTPAPGTATAPAAAPAIAASPTSSPASAGPRPAQPATTAPAPPPAPAATGAGRSREAIVIEQVAPKFPSRAERMQISEGYALVEYTIDRSGAVRDASVVESNPAGVFDEAALRAIARWRYQPKLADGKPVDSRKRFKFKFAR